MNGVYLGGNDSARTAPDLSNDSIAAAAKRAAGEAAKEAAKAAAKDAAAKKLKGIFRR